MRHYAKAKVFGLLPCLLILVDKLKVKPCVDIIQAVSHAIAPHLHQSSCSSPCHSFEDECEQAINSVLSNVDLAFEEDPFSPEDESFEDDDEDDDDNEEGSQRSSINPSPLLMACLMQLALGCQVLSFLSFRLHVHTGLMMAQQQLHTG